MTLIKNNLLPVAIVLAAVVLIIVLALPLADTEWANGFRVTDAAGGEGESFLEESGTASVFLFLLLLFVPVAKVALLMGVGGLLTALIRWLSKRLTTPQRKVT